MSLERSPKFLSLILRHKPELGKIKLDKNGWTPIIDVVNNAGFKLADLLQIIKEDGKQRFETSADNKLIRACQGHSKNLEIDLKLEKSIPPVTLYHGTKESVKLEIAKKGLLPMNREHVHMTTDIKLAKETADRRKGNSIILQIDTISMSAFGYKFYKTSNNVWLTYECPARFLTIVYSSL